MTALAPGAPPARGLLVDRRRRTIAYLGASLALVLGVVVAGTTAADAAQVTDLADRNLGPSAQHWFGTDRLGRDMLARVLAGLRLSLVVGTTATVISGLIAVVLAAAAAVAGGIADRAVSWLVDLFLALPHLVLLILLAFALGGGTEAVVVAVALTHWPTLTRVAPHLAGHFLVGTVLLFPHAILHEAALSFLGLGVDPAEPSIGVLLAESMRYLTAGAWWLAVLPGLCLLVVVKLVDAVGENTRALLDPRSHHL